MKKFENKNVLITGGNGGIGSEAVKKFISEGANVAVLDIHKELADHLSSLNQNIYYLQCDVSNEKMVSDCFKKAIEKFGQLHVVVNNAGIIGARSKTENYDGAEFDRVIDVNIKGVFYGMKEAILHFKEMGYGNIVNTSSLAGVVGMARNLAYSASKHAVLGLTKSAALEVARDNIRVNAICPGFIDTAMLDSTNDEPEFKEMLRLATPMKRFGNPAEIADAILYLASEQSSFMTGQGMILDGGVSLQ